MNIVNNASEKFKDKQDELCGFLFDVLRRISELEKEVCERSMEIRRQADAMGLPKSQMAPGSRELSAEYKQRLGGIVLPVCTEKLLKRGYGGSYGKPAKYEYIGGECEAQFAMRNAQRAAVITRCPNGRENHKFVLRETDGKWLIDEVYYSFGKDKDDWHIDDIR